MQVYKNFIDQVKFDDLAAVISSQQFPWYYNYIVEKKDLNPKMSINQNFQFTHTFFNFHRIQSEYFDLLTPIFQKIKPFSDDQWDKRNQGWVHQDIDTWFGGIVYLSKNPCPNSGTSAFKVKKGFSYQTQNEIQMKEKLV